MFTLCKEERLWGERVIANLFQHGRSFFQSPYKVVWIKIHESSAFPSRFGVSVSKRCFKRAVKRNLMKRRTREAFRLNRHILKTAVSDGNQIILMVIYTSDQLLPFGEVEKTMKKILHRIAQRNVESD